MKRINKVFLKILMILIIIQFFILVPTSKAGFWDVIFNSGENFLEEGKNQANNQLDTARDIDVQFIVEDIYSILFPLGIVITVAVGGILGIKFMMASAEDKAKVKESMVPYVIGCIVIYGAFGIWKIFIEIFSNL